MMLTNSRTSPPTTSGTSQCISSLLSVNDMGFVTAAERFTKAPVSVSALGFIDTVYQEIGSYSSCRHG